jgi:hypothetical protein
VTGKQQAVLWLGLILVIIRMFATGQWSLLWNTTTNPVFQGSGVAGQIGNLIGQGVGAILKHQNPKPGQPGFIGPVAPGSSQVPDPLQNPLNLAV